MSVRNDSYYGKSLSRQQCMSIWARCRDRAELGAKFTPHSARAILATLPDRMGEPLQIIQDLLGHANLSTTQTYTHYIVEYQDEPVHSANFDIASGGLRKVTLKIRDTIKEVKI